MQYGEHEQTALGFAHVSIRTAQHLCLRCKIKSSVDDVVNNAARQHLALKSITILIWICPEPGSDELLVTLDNARHKSELSPIRRVSPGARRQSITGTLVWCLSRITHRSDFFSEQREIFAPRSRRRRHNHLACAEIWCECPLSTPNGAAGATLSEQS
jgi:hypothetical protein